MIKHTQTDVIVTHKGTDYYLYKTNAFAKCQFCDFIDDKRCPAKLCQDGYLVEVI